MHAPRWGVVRGGFESGWMGWARKWAVWEVFSPLTPMGLGIRECGSDRRSWTMITGEVLHRGGTSMWGASDGDVQGHCMTILWPRRSRRSIDCQGFGPPGGSALWVWVRVVASLLPTAAVSWGNHGGLSPLQPNSSPSRPLYIEWVGFPSWLTFQYGSNTPPPP